MRRQPLDLRHVEQDDAGIGGSRPLIALSSVVLPDPLGPISPTISPDRA
jgi:hypothetical protein